MTEKRCTTCGQVKSLSDFYPRPQSKDGLCHVCKPCRRAASAATYAANPQRCHARGNLWKKKNPESVAASRNRYYQKPGMKERYTAYSAKQRDTLSDGYVRGVLSHHGKIPRDLIPPQLVEAERLHILILRSTNRPRK